MNNRAQTLLLNILLYFALLFLTTAGISSYLQVQKFREASDWVSHTYQVIGQTRLTLINYLHADISAHNYVVTGNPDELKVMQDSLRFVNTTFDKISAMTADNPIQVQNFKTLKPILTQKEQELLDMTKDRSITLAQNTIDSQALISGLENVIAQELGLLQNRSTVSQTDAKSASMLVVGANILSILLLGMSFILINFHLIQRNRAQNDLRDMESKLKKIIDGSRDLIAAVDTNLNYIAFNTSYEQKFKSLFHKNLALGKNIREGLDNISNNQEIINAWNRAINGDELVIINRWTSKNATDDDHYYEIAFSPMYNDTKKIIGAMHIMRDITERMRVDQLKNEFVSIVSHELRTPLTSIRGALGLLVGGAIGKFDQKTTNILNIAHNNCERLIHLINDILDISKIETGTVDFQLTPIDLQKTVEESVTANQPFAEKFKVTIKLQKSSKMIFVYADYGRLMQVITNLISNAVKFSPEGSEVIVNISLDSKTARVSIIDHGQGISEDFQKQIFQKFAQAETSLTRKQSGTGLGLSISKAIIEKLHGTIGYTTQAGIGSTFYFDLPIWLESSDKTEPAKPSIALNPNPIIETEIQVKNMKILYVEDDLDLSEIVRKVLENEAEIIAVQSNQQALDVLSKQKIDLVLLDLVLPDGYGANLIPVITKQNIPIIIFSAYDLPQKYVPFVLKALVKSQTTNQELVDTIRTAMKRHTTGRTG
jgi:PAS domain S-box-containing protein